jgi:hypothetical protein
MVLFYTLLYLSKDIADMCSVLFQEQGAALDNKRVVFEADAHTGYQA